MPKRKTQEQFVKEVEEKFNGEYSVLGQYVNNREDVLIKHNKCGNTFMKRPHDMVGKRLSGCPYCNGNKNKLYNEEWVINNTPKPYKYVSGYSKMSAKCIFYCENCKSNFSQSPSRLINEKLYGCNCQPTKRKTNEEFLADIGDTLLEYEVMEPYINIETPILFKHIPCQTVFSISPYNFIYKHNKQYCPICYYKKSKGEIAVNKYLENHNIKYNKEYIFDNLPNKRFDFYLPDYNCCIEYDGKQHFKAVDYFGGQEAFLETQKRDFEKNKYCIENNIQLIRIPYTEFNNIQTILEKIFEEKSPETIEKYTIY